MTQHRLLAIAFLITGQWTLTLLDATGKHLLAHGVSLPAITFVRYFAHTVVVAIILAPRLGLSVFRARAWRWQIARGLLAVLTTVVFFSVLHRLPLAEATALNFIAPLAVVALSAPLLGEKFGRVRWIGVIGGFLGMLIVMRPGTGLDPVGVGLGLLSAAVFTAFHLVTRRMAGLDAAETTLIWTGAFGTLVATFGLPFFNIAWPQSALDWALLVSTGVSGSLGAYLFLLAYKNAPASFIAPFVYAQIVAAIIVGWWIFDQWPDRITAVGLAIICASGTWVAWRESRLQTPSRPAAIES